MATNNLLSEQVKYTGESKTPTHLHLCSYNGNGMTCHNGKSIDELTDFMNAGDINWIQVHGLQNAECVQQVCRHFGIDFLITQDILNANHLTKIEEQENYNIIILKLLSRGKDNHYEPQQLSIVQGGNFLITFSEEDTDFFGDIVKAIDKNVLKIRNRQSDFLLSVILNSVMASFMSILADMEDELDDLEELLLSTDENNTPGIDSIQAYRRDYRLIKKSILPLKEQINKLLHTDSAILHKNSQPFFNDVNDHLQFVLQTLDVCRDMITALVDLYLSNNDRRMNNIMRQLTIVSVIFIPLTFLAGIWGMNYRYMPELDWKYGYLFAWLLMALVAGGIYLYFRKKKWYKQQ